MYSGTCRSHRVWGIVWGNSVWDVVPAATAAAVDADAEAAGDPADTALDALMMAVDVAAGALPWALAAWY